MAKGIGRRIVEMSAFAAVAAGGLAGCGDEAPAPNPDEHVIVVTSPPDTPESGPPDVSGMLIKEKETQIVGDVNKLIVLGATCLIDEAPGTMQPDGYDAISNEAAAKGKDGERGTKDDKLVVEVGRDRSTQSMRVTIRDHRHNRSVEAVMASDATKPAFRGNTPDEAPDAANVSTMLRTLDKGASPLSGRAANYGLAASMEREGPDATKWTLYNQTDERWAPSGPAGATAWAGFTLQTGGEMMVDYGHQDCGLLPPDMPTPENPKSGN